MASFRFDVDTEPMARSVDTAKRHINGVNGAVVAMQAAVIAAEVQSSKKICDNVDNGFYNMLKSQISQKAAAAYSEMDSTQIMLLYLAKAIDKITRQMESDYHMITKRYEKLFKSLDKELEIRIKELDRPAMQLADIKKNIVFDKLKDSTSMLLSFSTDALPVAHIALSGKLKQKTLATMQTLSESIDDNTAYSKKVESILVNSDTDSANSNNKYLPTIFLATDSLLNSGDFIEKVYPVDTWQNTAVVVSEVNRIHNDLKWDSVDKSEKDAVRREFLALCEKEAGEERLSKEIIRLFDESAWEVLHK